MAAQMLPASASWYCSRVLDSNRQGLIVFGAKNCVYVFRVTGPSAEYVSCIRAHSDRVVGVSLSADNGSPRCATTSEDGRVKVWDVISSSILKEHSHHTNKPTVVHWSPVDENLIVSGDDKGGVIVYHPTSTEHSAMSFDSACIFSLTCSPHVTDHVAIGYKTGVILVVSMARKGGEVIHRLRGHDDEIHCLAWCPSPGEELSWTKDHGESPPEVTPEVTPEDGGFLLASGCKDRTIRVWSLSKGKAISTMKLPYNTGHRRDRYDDQKARVWVTLHWPRERPGELVSSSFNGDLLLWDLARPGKQKWQLFTSGALSRGHYRIVFNICAAGEQENTLCSISMDRQINLWSLDTMSGESSIATLGGFVYAVAVSPVHPGRLAVGCGDNMLRVWNVENPGNPYDVQSFWQGIKSKVTSLSWHPVKENLLAYGTEDGRVGIYDVLSNKAPHISSTYHKRTVYVVKWGPSCVKKDEKASEGTVNLYSCGDGVVWQHFVSNLEKDAVNINKIIDNTNPQLQKTLPRRSEISWKPDLSVVALGNEDGTIEVFSAPHLLLLCTVHVHKKLVNCIAWHPRYTAESSEPRRCQHWIASGSNEQVIHVTDLSNALNMPGEGDKVVTLTESFCQLEAHSNRVTGLSWSVHQEGHLVSASYDWTAQVWDVKTRQPLANFRGHRGKLLCVTWCHLVPGVVYTGADDHTLQKWEVTTQPDKLPPTCVDRVKRKARTRGKPKNRLDTIETPETKPTEHSPGGSTHTISDSTNAVDLSTSQFVESADTMQELQKLLDLKRLELQQKDTSSMNINSNHLVNGSAGSSQGEPVEAEEEETEIASMKHSVFTKASKPELTTTKKDDRKDRRKKKWKSLFPLSSSLDNRGKSLTQEDCVLLAKQVYSEPSHDLQGDQWHLGSYLDRRSIYSYYEKENEGHVAAGNWEQSLTLGCFRGNCKELLVEARDVGMLNDWLVSLAPSVSTELWREMCVSYAKQLEKDGNFQKSATYYLSAHKVYEAIDMLRNNHMIKEAVSLAKVRLSPLDPLISELYQAWGEQLTKDGNLEMAAKCFLANKNPQEAARVLTKRSDQSALMAAIQILISANEIEAIKLYSQKYIQQCLTKCDWSAAAQVIQLHPCCQMYALTLSVHQTVTQELVAMGLLDPEVTANSQSYQAKGKARKLPCILLETDALPTLPWEPRTINNEVFINHVVHDWHERWEVDFSLKNIRALYQQLMALKQVQQSQTGVRQVLQEVSLYLSLGLLKFILSDTEEATYWWAEALQCVYSAGHQDMLQGLCRILLPNGPDELSKLQQQVRATRILLTKDNPTSLSRNERRVSLTPRCQHQAVAGDLTVHTTRDKCHGQDSLSAYYWLAVLEYLLKTDRDHPQCKTEIGAGDSVQSEEGIAGEAPPTSGDGDSDSSADIQKQTEKFTVDWVCVMARSLLWDIQADHFQLQESMEYISKAIATLIANHKAASISNSQSEGQTQHTNSESESLTQPTSSQSENMSHLNISPGQILRPISGEYIKMYGGQFEPESSTYGPHHPSLASPKDRSSFMLLRTPSVVEDYEQMDPHSETCTPQCDIGEGSDQMLTPNHCDPTQITRRTPNQPYLTQITPLELNKSDLTQIQPLEDDSPSSDTDREVERIITPVESTDQLALKDSDNDNVLPPGDKPGVMPSGEITNRVPLGGTTEALLPGYKFETLESPKKSEVSATRGRAEVAPPCDGTAADRRSHLPLDVRFSRPDVTLIQLTQEQTRVRRELEILQENVQKLPFPNPLDSSMKLVKWLAYNKIERGEIRNQILSWMETHSYLQTHFDFILDTDK